MPARVPRFLVTGFTVVYKYSIVRMRGISHHSQVTRTPGRILVKFQPTDKSHLTSEIHPPFFHLLTHLLRGLFDAELLTSILVLFI